MTCVMSVLCVVGPAAPNGKRASGVWCETCLFPLTVSFRVSPVFGPSVVPCQCMSYYTRAAFAIHNIRAGFTVRWVQPDNEMWRDKRLRQGGIGL